MSAPGQRPARATACLLLLGAALLLGWLAERGQLFHQARPAAPEWHGAQWVGLDEAADTLYLRRSFVVAGRPQQAWLTMAATDRFALHINGKPVGRSDYLGERPTATFDLTRMLTAGSNTVAIEVTRSSRRHQAAAIAQVTWQLGGTTETIGTDGSWRAASHPQPAAGGTLPWTADAYPDAGWPAAHALASGALAELPPAGSIPPALLAEAPAAQWIWHAGRETPHGAFARELRLDEAWIGTAWLGIAVDGAYTVAINGFVLPPAAGVERRMDILDIAPFLQRGDNRIVVQASAAAAPLRLAIAGRIEGAAGRHDFSSDERWHSMPERAPALVLADAGNDRPALALARSTPPQSLTLFVWQRRAFYVLAVLAALAALGIYHARSLVAAGVEDGRAWLLFAQPWGAAALLVALCLLADLDPRIELGWLYPFWLPAAVLVAVAAWLALQAARRPALRGG